MCVHFSVYTLKGKYAGKSKIFSEHFDCLIVSDSDYFT